MPQCAKCRDFFPPEFTVVAEEDDKLCIFCKRDYILLTKMLKEELDNPEKYEELMRKFALGDVEEESRIIKPF